MLRSANFTGYRLHKPIYDEVNSIVVKPDISFVGRRIATFVNGCYWHRCPRCQPQIPKNNQQFGTDKFEDNIARDRFVKQKLRLMGWKSITIWECELSDSPSFLKELSMMWN